jgi:hypothetical protein
VASAINEKVLDLPATFVVPKPVKFQVLAIVLNQALRSKNARV